MLVRHVLSGLTLAAGICALAAPLSAQTVDARLIGLGGLHLGRSGSLSVRDETVDLAIARLLVY